MLSVKLICVGKLGEKFWADAVREYEKRLSAYCKLEIAELPEQRLPQTPSAGEIAAALAKESAAICAKIPQGASVIALCVEGKTLSSEAFADKLGTMAAHGVSRLCLLIGGSCGLDEALKQDAALRLSMSPMTFPHHLARVMVLEQLYRALNILAGGKYHK
ncbi:23S rRNA (pseudouridine(1915)-N(3))-methyltransferase RlmH [Intestinibacillus massiliensis]|nr:23S rRNA (pseudouridine(1915)-N(3))-methyltransferase RlmH [Intestinibacillus massiliensis]